MKKTLKPEKTKKVKNIRMQRRLFQLAEKHIDVFEKTREIEEPGTDDQSAKRSDLSIST